MLGQWDMGERLNFAVQQLRALCNKPGQKKWKSADTAASPPPSRQTAQVGLSRITSRATQRMIAVLDRATYMAELHQLETGARAKFHPFQC